jgi:hypothetical protein
MCFWQASAPVGWTLNASQNDKALRVVNGAGGVSGGTNPFSTVMAQTAVGNYTLAVADMPAHAHPGSSAATSYRYYTPDLNQGVQAPTGANAIGALGNVNLSIAAQGGGGAHAHPITMAIQYIDVILASKN